MDRDVSLEAESHVNIKPVRSLLHPVKRHGPEAVTSLTLSRLRALIHCLASSSDHHRQFSWLAMSVTE